MRSDKIFNQRLGSRPRAANGVRDGWGVVESSGGKYKISFFFFFFFLLLFSFISYHRCKTFDSDKSDRQSMAQGRLPLFPVSNVKMSAVFTSLFSSFTEVPRHARSSPFSLGFYFCFSYFSPIPRRLYRPFVNPAIRYKSYCTRRMRRNGQMGDGMDDAPRQPRQSISLIRNSKANFNMLQSLPPSIRRGCLLFKLYLFFSRKREATKRNKKPIEPWLM